ncbi:MAG: hypothetical protein IB616_02695 [Methanosarcinales archaeon]|nr:MAG: hypothetical protein IB616_02695 [Methanosarcinales archaeon]
MTEIQPKTDEEIERLRQEFEEIKMERLKEQFREVKAERLKKTLEETPEQGIQERHKEIRDVKKSSIIVTKIKSALIILVGVVFVFLGGFFLGSLNLVDFPELITPPVLQDLSYVALGLGIILLVAGAYTGFVRRR